MPRPPGDLRRSAVPDADVEVAHVWVRSLVRAWSEVVRAAPDQTSVDDVFGARISDGRDDHDPGTTAVYVEVYRVNDAKGVRVVVAAEVLVTLVADPAIRRAITARPARLHLSAEDAQRARQAGDDRRTRAP